MSTTVRAWAIAASLLIPSRGASSGEAPSPPPTREECEAANPASWGRAGKDVVWIPTFDSVVLAMLSMAKVTPDDLVLDLGAGDGKIGIAAAKPPFGARALGIEYDHRMATLAQCLVKAEGVADKVRMIEGDIFKEDFAGASVVTMYLLPHLNLCVRHRLLAMEPGTRVVSNKYAMGDWEPVDSVSVLGREVRLWIVPARVDGVWDFQDSEGAAFVVDLRQVFGALSGEVTRSGAASALVGGRVLGRDLRFSFADASRTIKFSGTVRGGEATGVLLEGARAWSVTGRLRGVVRSAPWAEMLPGCEKYYGAP